MTAAYPTIQLYAYLNSAWVDLTADFLDDETRAGWGMTDNKPLTRLAGTGTLDLVLNNTANKYSPGHASALSGWGVGVKIKVVFTYDSVAHPSIWYIVTPNGIRITPGTRGERRAYVSCVDWMDYAAKHPIVNPGILTNKRGDEVITTTIALLPVNSTVATDLDTGANTFPTVFDTVTSHTKAYNELVKVALSEMGFAYLKHDKTNGETLVFENAYARNGLRTETNIPVASVLSGKGLREDGGYELREDGGYELRDETETFNGDNTFMGADITHGDNLLNRLTVNAYPRKVDAAATTVLFNLEKEITIPAGGTYVLKGTYANPDGGLPCNGMDMVNPVATTDYLMNDTSGGGGGDTTADLTVSASYGSEGFTHTLTNGDTVTGYVTFFRCRGKAIRVYNPIEHAATNTASINEYGTQSDTLNQKYQNTLYAGAIAAEAIVEMEREPETRINKVTFCANSSSALMQAFLNLDVGDMVRLKETQNGIDAYYYIQGVEYSILPRKIIMFSWIVKQTLNLALGLSLISLNVGGGVYMDGSCVDYGYLPYTTDVRTKSYSFWYYLNTDNGGAEIMGLQIGNSTNYFDNVYMGSGKIYYENAVDPAGAGIIAPNNWITDAAISSNVWHYIVVTHDGSTAATTAPIIYVDGAAVAITNLNTNAGSYLSQVGKHFILGTPVPGSEVEGDIDVAKIKDARFYNRVLTAAEVATIYAEGAGGTGVTSGMVFQGPVVKTKNDDSYENLTLTGANKLLENIYNVVGTPIGSPISELLYSNTAPGGNVAFVSASSKTGAAVSTTNWTHTVAVGNNRLLVVEVALRGSDTVNAVTAAVGGVSRSLKRFNAAEGGNTSGDSRVEIWYLIAPTVGVNTITVTLSAASYIQAGAMNFTSVNQLAPFGAFASANGTSTAPTVNAVGATGDMVVDILSSYATATVGAGQTDRFNVTSDTSWRGAGSTEAGAASVTMSWTLGTSQKWQIGAVAIKAAP